MTSDSRGFGVVCSPFGGKRKDRVPVGNAVCGPRDDRQRARRRSRPAYLIAAIWAASSLLWRFALFLCTRPAFAARSSTCETFGSIAFASSFLPVVIAARIAFSSDLMPAFTLRLREVRLTV